MKILVIGAGMSGLTYAIVAAACGNDVVVAERNARVGKKIAMTGNGRCNVGNAHVGVHCYNDSPIVSRVLSEIDVQEYKSFLQSCGIYTYQDAEGRMYPLSDSASGVVDCLRQRLARLGGKTLCDCTVSRVARVSSGYDVVVNGKSHHYDKVVLACGSRSQAVEPELDDIIGGGKLTKRYPSLVPVRIAQMPSVLNGIRAKAGVTLYCDGKELAKEDGEVLFKDYGLSGICIFNLSAIIARRAVRSQGGQYTFSIDLVPSMTTEELASILSKRIKQCAKQELFYGILHNKVAECVVKQSASIDAYTLAKTAKSLFFSYDKLLDWSMSQVTAGGIDTRYVNTDTLTLDNGIVVLGEVLDVDGICGGNNLFFAAASALCTFSKQDRQRAYKV